MGLFTGDKLEAWEIERGRALEAVAKAERLHNATLRMLGRIEQANIDHRERDLDASGNQPAGKTPAQEEIDLDNFKRAEEIRAARMRDAIKVLEEGGRF
jgi:hypothetical protein